MSSVFASESKMTTYRMKPGPNYLTMERVNFNAHLASYPNKFTFPINNPTATPHIKLDYSSSSHSSL